MRSGVIAQSKKLDEARTQKMKDTILGRGKRMARPECHLARPESHLARPKRHLARPENHLACPRSNLARPENNLARPDCRLAPLGQRSHLARPESHLARPANHLARPENRLARPESHLPRSESHLARPETRKIFDTFSYKLRLFSLSHSPRNFFLGAGEPRKRRFPTQFFENYGVFICNSPRKSS